MILTYDQAGEVENIGKNWNEEEKLKRNGFCFVKLDKESEIARSGKIMVKDPYAW